MNDTGMPETNKIAPPQAAKPVTLRDRIVAATPAFIVNSSSNVIGLMHIVAETLMLKASGVIFWQNTRNIGNQLAKIKEFKQDQQAIVRAAEIAQSTTGLDVIEAAKAIEEAAAQAKQSPHYLARAQGIGQLESEITELKRTGVSLIDPPRNLWRAMTGADKDKLMQNQWSTRSTLSGFTAWVLGSILPERKETPETGAEDPNETLTKYAGKKLIEGIQIGNPDTKRQQIGLGVTLAGLFSAISGFNNINLKTGARFTNPAHAIGGLITALSGANLLFAKNERDGWKGFGSTLWLRLPLAGWGTYKKYANHDRWGYYGAGQITFQSAALYAYLFGGVEKLPDGTVVETKKGHHATPTEPETPKLKPLIEAPVPEPVTSEAAPQTKVAAIEPAARLAELPVQAQQA